MLIRHHVLTDLGVGTHHREEILLAQHHALAAARGTGGEHQDHQGFVVDAAGQLRLSLIHIYENISYEKSIEVLEKQCPGHGEEYATKLRDYTIALYKKCAEYALSRGIIIADTKFEFGLDENGNVVLGDEMLTPDSSRFWPLEGYEPGHSQPSFDKQFVRDWLKANPDSNYDLPQDVIDKTIAKYLEAYELLTGKKL